MKKFLCILTVLSLFTLSARAQNFRPEIYGALKTKFETDTRDGQFRFNVRNSRLGVRGNATANMRYALQLELNSQGKLDVLDSYVTYSIGGFELSLGQQQYKFSTELNRGAGNNYFANRSFMGKFITNYYDLTPSGRTLGEIGSRDIGALAEYNFKTTLPVTLTLGAFNGSGINNPRWGNRVNFITHVQLGGPEGFGGGGSFYTGSTPMGDRINMWGVEGRYRDGRLIVEGEFAQRFLVGSGTRDRMSIAVIHALYKIPLPANRLAENIAPVARWDYGDNMPYFNHADQVDKFSGHRATVGLTVTLTENLLRSELRFNYEHYFLESRPVDFASNPLLHNKFTVEFFVAF